MSNEIWFYDCLCDNVCLMVISNKVRDLGALAPQHYASLDFSPSTSSGSK